MKLQLKRYVVVIVRQEIICRRRRRPFHSQPGVSRQCSAEAELGFAIFVRTRNRSSVTEPENMCWKLPAGFVNDGGAEIAQGVWEGHQRTLTIATTHTVPIYPATPIESFVKKYRVQFV